MYARTTCQLSGQWQYDASSNRLRFASMMNGIPVVYNEELRVVRGSGGQFQLQASNGSQWVVQRLY